MAKKVADRDTYIRILKKLKEFRLQRHEYPPLRENDFFYSKLDRNIVHSYYNLRKEIKASGFITTRLKILIKKMPMHIWLLWKGIFETLMIVGLLLILFFYIKYVPVFKGYLPVYISFSGLSWFFLRRAIENLNSDLHCSIADFIEALEEDLKDMKRR